MPAILVHGVPETPAVWDSLRSHLIRSDVLTFQLPGFGCSRPEGFGATKEEYVAWLVDQLERARANGPVDLVGHDWGGGLVVRAVSIRPDLVRSWMTDAASIGDVDFEWHEFAKMWQTPGTGEEFFEQQLSIDADERGTTFEMFGVPADAARKLGSWLDQTMVGCILDLYRSAVDVGKEWGPDFANIQTPGSVILPSDDPFLSVDGARRAARNAGASVAELPGVGHWWMLQDPARGAHALEEFWAALGSGE